MNKSSILLQWYMESQWAKNLSGKRKRRQRLVERKENKGWKEEKEGEGERNLAGWLIGFTACQWPLISTMFCFPVEVNGFFSLQATIWFGLVSLFNGISTLFRLFNAKAILLEEQ